MRRTLRAINRSSFKEQPARRRLDSSSLNWPEQLCAQWRHVWTPPEAFRVRAWRSAESLPLSCLLPRTFGQVPLSTDLRVELLLLSYTAGRTPRTSLATVTPAASSRTVSTLTSYPAT